LITAVITNLDYTMWALDSADSRHYSLDIKWWSSPYRSFQSSYVERCRESSHIQRNVLYTFYSAHAFMRRITLEISYEIHSPQSRGHYVFCWLKYMTQNQKSVNWLSNFLKKPVMLWKYCDLSSKCSQRWTISEKLDIRYCSSLLTSAFFLTWAQSWLAITDSCQLQWASVTCIAQVTSTERWICGSMYAFSFTSNTPLMTYI
jgi:hypothetical protein